CARENWVQYLDWLIFDFW
nr:immunoglobulin heavy chain junction region [Macaca mulatta]MOV88809.1 immunoglobulin heavy chain junction region [Macaca mulatta]MOV89497.1 immunoglobulin heavy chain junction region [Macaca mulatta]MOV91146.1 immunoglobulin heavy chain junction region [Macaca mulatta]